MDRLVVLIGVSLLLFMSPKLCGAQVMEIYGDTNIVKPSAIKLGESIFYYWDFVVSMPSGKYKYYETSDSLLKSLDSELLIEGEFVDGKRHGSFKYHSSFPTGKEIERKTYVYMDVNYCFGELHGQYFVYQTNGFKLEEGNYRFGKKSGVFVIYDEYNHDGTIGKIRIYENDTLLNSVKYHADGRIFESTFGIVQDSCKHRLE